MRGASSDARESNTASRASARRSSDVVRVDVRVARRVEVAPCDQRRPVGPHAHDPVFAVVGSLAEELRRLRQKLKVGLVAVELAIFEEPFVRLDAEVEGSQ